MAAAVRLIPGLCWRGVEPVAHYPANGYGLFDISSYLVGSRGREEIATGTNHLGFRRLRDPAGRADPSLP